MVFGELTLLDLWRIVGKRAKLIKIEERGFCPLSKNNFVVEFDSREFFATSLSAARRLEDFPAPDKHGRRKGICFLPPKGQRWREGKRKWTGCVFVPFGEKVRILNQTELAVETKNFHFFGIQDTVLKFMEGNGKPMDNPFFRGHAPKSEEP
jgi:hypothetical protein